MSAENSSPLGALDVVRRLGILDLVIRRLVDDKPSAARKLRIALGEVDRGYGAFREALNRIDLLPLDSESRDKTIEELRSLATGTIALRVKAAKGSCTLIGNIYDQHLSGWFSKLDREHADELRQLFNDLRYSDGVLLSRAESLSKRSADDAQAMLDLIEAGQIDEASKLAKNLSAEYRPALKQLNEMMAFLYQLENRVLEELGVA